MEESHDATAETYITQNKVWYTVFHNFLTKCANIGFEYTEYNNKLFAVMEISHKLSKVKCAMSKELKYHIFGSTIHCKNEAIYQM